MSYVIFYLCLSAVALACGMFAGKKTDGDGVFSMLSNGYAANLAAVLMSTGFVGGLVGTIAMTNYTDLTFWPAVGMFAALQLLVFFAFRAVLGRPAITS